MSKVRIYEYAKQKNVSSKEIISKLKEMNVEVSNHMSMIDGNAINKLDEWLSSKNKTQASNSNHNSNQKNQNKVEDQKKIDKKKWKLKRAS